MQSYDSIKQKHSQRVNQTIDTPIMVFDYFELGEVFAALGALLLFGIIIYSWQLMFLSLFVTLGIAPIVRRKNKKGIFFHWPYRHLGMRLPGLVNPRGNKKFSD